MDFVRADNCLIRALIKSEKVYISFIKRQYEDNNSHIALHQKSWQRQTTEMTQLKAKKPLSQLTGNCVHNSQDSRTSFTFSKRFSPKSCFKKWVVYLFIHLEEQTQYFLKCIGDASSAFNILSHLLASTVDVLCICYFTHWWRSKFCYLTLFVYVVDDLIVALWPATVSHRKLLVWSYPTFSYLWPFNAKSMWSSCMSVRGTSCSCHLIFSERFVKGLKR